MATSDSDKALAAYYHAEAEAYRKYAAYWRTVDDERMALICDGWAVDDDKQAVVHERDFEAEVEARGGCGQPGHVTESADEGTCHCATCEREADIEAMRLEELDAAPARQEVYNGD